MLREEAIRIIETVFQDEYVYKYYDSITHQALDIAIEALKSEPSEDLIKRSDAIEAIEIVDWYHQNSNKDMVHGANSDEHQAWYKAQDIYEALEAVPSADRPKGEWIRTDFEDCVDGEHIKWARWNCSECGVEKKIWWVKDVNFCPNCGADMRGNEK